MYRVCIITSNAQATFLYPDYGIASSVAYSKVHTRSVKSKSYRDTETSIFCQ